MLWGDIASGITLLGGALPIVVFVATLALVLAKPRGIHEAWWTALGAFAMAATGHVHASDVREIFDVSRDAMLFLVGLLVLSALVERSGLFSWAATRAAIAAQGDGRALFRNLFFLGALVTAVLSLDTTAVLLTPVLLLCVRRLRVPALPYVVGCAFVANSASLPLPISNLTNLIQCASFDVRFTTFAAKMLAPQLVVLAIEYALLRVVFRRDLGPFAVCDASPEDVPHEAYFRATIAILVASLAGYFVGAWVGIPPWMIAFAASASLLALGLRAGRVDRAMWREIPWGVVPFALGLFVVVQGVDDLGLPGWLASRLDALPPSRVVRALVTTGASALLSNAVNNLPACLVTRAALLAAKGGREVVLPSLVGTNVGPNVLPFGSLASVLVLSIARAKGVDMPVRTFVLAGLLVTPLACAAAALVLAYS